MTNVEQSRRDAERRVFHLAVYILGYCAIPATTVDISSTGALVEIEPDSGLGSEIMDFAQKLRTVATGGLRLEFRDLAIHIAAEVVRVTTGDHGQLRAALRFAEKPPAPLLDLLER